MIWLHFILFVVLGVILGTSDDTRLPTWRFWVILTICLFVAIVNKEIGKENCREKEVKPLTQAVKMLEKERTEKTMEAMAQEYFDKVGIESPLKK